MLSLSLLGISEIWSCQISMNQYRINKLLLNLGLPMPKYEEKQRKPVCRGGAYFTP
jgi:hypothetical protein